MRGAVGSADVLSRAHMACTRTEQRAHSSCRPVTSNAGMHCWLNGTNSQHPSAQ